MNFFKKKELKVVLWSYNDEGKTHLLYQGFKGIKNFKTIPTCGFNVETINFNGIDITFWDWGYGRGIKERRQYYLSSCDAVIFLIDSSQPLPSTPDVYCYFKDNYEELQKCIKIIEDIPLLIAITKIDIRKVNTLDLINAYQLQNLFERKKKFGIIECSSFTSEGIKEIEYWLSNLVKK